LRREELEVDFLYVGGVVALVAATWGLVLLCEKVS